MVIQEDLNKPILHNSEKQIVIVYTTVCVLDMLKVGEQRRGSYMPMKRGKSI